MHRIVFPALALCLFQVACAKEASQSSPGATSDHHGNQASGPLASITEELSLAMDAAVASVIAHEERAVVSAMDAAPSADVKRKVRGTRPPVSASEDEPCNTVMSEAELCGCVSQRSAESELSCEVSALASDELAAMRTAGGDLYAVARHGKGWYELGRVHSAGMEDFALRSARVEHAGRTRVLRLVTFSQVGSSDWMHTANHVVLCPLTGPADARGGCFDFPLYAHTREMVNDVANEQESKFRVALTTDGSAIVRTRGPLQHPELRAELGEQWLRKPLR